MNDQIAPTRRSAIWIFPLTSKLVLSFALLCAIMAAIGGVFFFSLRSIKELNAEERSSTLGEIAILQTVDKNIGLQQVEVFRHVAADDPKEKLAHEQNIARLMAANTKGLTAYEPEIDTDPEKHLYTALLEARKTYNDSTNQLLSFSRRNLKAEATAFLLASHVPAYDRYQSSLDALLRFEQAEGRAAAADMTNRIEQDRLVGNALIGLAIIIVLGTGVAVWRIVARLRQDKERLRTEVAEHEQAEKALRVGEERYRLLVDHSPDAILVVCDERIVFANPTAIKLLGADRLGQLVGRKVSEILHPDERAEVARRASEVAAGGLPPMAERRLIRLDGSIVDVESRVISFLYEGRPAIQVIVQDKTERKTVEKQLREADEKYRAIFENASEGIFQNTLEGKAISANPALARMLGFASPEELIRERNDIGSQSYVDPARRPKLQRLLEEKGVVKNFEYEVRRKDESAIFVSENIRLIRDAAGHPLYYEGSMQDITERKRSEQALRESDEKFQQLANNIADVFWITSPDLKMMHYVSAGYELIWGRSSASLYANPHQWIETIVEEDRERAHAVFGGLIGDESEISIEYRIARPDGTIRWIHDRGFQVRDAAGTVVRLTGIASDITERKLAGEVLAESERRFREMLENVELIAMTLDRNGVITFCNDHLLKVTGWKWDEVIGMDWCEKFLPDSAAVARTTFFENIEAGKIPTHYENPIKSKSGELREIAWNNTMLRDAAGAIVGTASVGEDVTERKRAEQVLAESERRFRLLSDLGDATRSLLESKDIMASATRLLGTHLHVSRCAYAEVENDGNHFTIPGDYTDGCASIVGKYQLSDFGEQTHALLTAGRDVVLRDVDAELTPATGAEAYNSIAIKAMIACPLIKNGRLIAAMAVQHSAPRLWSEDEISLVREVIDRCWSIIERARTEIVLRESEERLRLVIAGSNDGIFEHDYVTDVLTWSDRMYEMLGFARQSFIPTVESFTALLHPDDRASFQDAVARQMIQGGRYDAHIRIRRHDGSYGNFLARGRVVLNAAGKPLQIIGSVADLTSLLQAEHKLVEQGNLLNLAQDAIMVRDMNDRFEFWNHGAEVLYGWTAEEVQGHPNDDFLEYERAVKIIAEHTLLETGVWSGDCRHRTKKGDTVIVRSRWTLVRDEHGQPKSKLIIATDMTEQKKVEEQFLRAQRLESIGTLASGVAHDLNNILVPIMMAAPVLRGEMDPVEREKFLDIVEASAHRGAEIIKQVLTFARGADGDRVLLQPIYLLEEISKIASQTFPKSITLRTSYDENTRSLVADSTQLHQVLLNLCINARDAMPDGGELLLRAENFDVDEHYARMTPGATAGPHVVLQITDTGNGISKEVLGKIFDPFFTTKNLGKGTGLGLSTVAGIVRSHGGFIQVESRPGRTSFKIFLPAKDSAGITGGLAPDLMIPRGHGETILLVDDEPTIREVAEFILNSHGYRALVAADGSAALALFAQEMGRIALVITDLAMPGMGGLMLAQTLRRITPRLKVIVSTGGAEESLGTEFAALNLDGYLTKPYTRSNLLLKVSHVLQNNLQDAA